MKSRIIDKRNSDRAGGLYNAEYEHDACGVGMIVNINGDKSHELVDSALTVLENMKHRGAEGADNKTGDGAGILLQIPHEFILLQGIPVPEKGKYGTGLVFFPKEKERQSAAMRIFEEEVEREGLSLLHVREVPVNTSVLGKTAADTEPDIRQVFITGDGDSDNLERRLYLVRKKIEKRIGDKDFYIVSLSSKTIIYKGMLSSVQLRDYFCDLTQPYFTSGLAIVHSRFSTNTFPAWSLAQPFRMLAHNGEINTIRGNRGWMEARESVLSNSALGDVKAIRPIVQPGMSDSASLDNVLEFFVMSGLSLPHAMAMLVPESFNDKNPISEDLKAFYEYHSILMEPWDGPAAILFSDGEQAGAVLDRNGLRPARYLVTNDGYLILASKVGALPIPPERIVRKSRLQPGKMLLVDTRTGTVLEDREFKHRYAAEHPYGEWLDQELLQLADIPILNRKAPEYTALERNRLYKAFGYTYDEIHSAILPMAKNGAEPTASMGADIPLAVLSEKHQLLFYYFTGPMDIATQRPELRKNFCGKPDYVVNFMEFVAQELRMIMAKLGVRTVDELVGHTEYLRILPHQITQRAAMVDVSGILARCSEENCHYDPAQHFDFKLDATLDKQVLLPLLPKKGKAAAPKCCNVDISCSDRAFGTLFCAEITRRWGSALEDDTYQIHCRGGAG